MFQSRILRASMYGLFVATALNTTVLDGAHAQGLTELANEAVRLHGLHKDAEASAIAERALPLAVRLYGSGHTQTADWLDILGSLYRYQGRFAEAEPHFKRALAIREKAQGPGRADVATAPNVSIHAPHGERRPRAVTSLGETMFQSTPPHGERPLVS